MWMYDLAREQAPTLDHLRQMCRLSLESGYNALGLYLEHRFLYASAPWAAGTGALTAEMVKTLESEFPDLQIVPFANLLGHFEGMLYTEEGKRYREERFQGMQACPSKPEFVAFAKGLIDDVLDAFKSKLVHIGGDETWQLGKCPECTARVQAWDKEGLDGKAVLYSEHFAPLANYVAQKGRRPAIWGDMLIDHPTAADRLPKNTLLFDWQYFGSCLPTSRTFKSKGFDVVCCPAFHTYNATWFHVLQSEQNVRQLTREAREIDAEGVCVTTWENGLFGSYETLFPALRAAGGILSEGAGASSEPFPGLSWIKPNYDSGTPSVDLCMLSIPPAIARLIPAGVAHLHRAVPFAREHESLWIALEDPENRNAMDAVAAASGMQISVAQAHGGAISAALQRAYGKELASGREVSPLEFPIEDSLFLKAYANESERYETWARLMGVELQCAGGTFEFGGIRSSLKVRLLLNANPFLAWLHHAEELSGPVGDQALRSIEEALALGPNEATKGIALFARSSIEFVRLAEHARKAYADKKPEEAISKLAIARKLFDDLERVAMRTHARIGGSMADIERCKIARDHVDRVIKRIRDYGDGKLGYLPAFEHLTHHKFVAHDQAAWWLINRWANE